ncbi:tim: triose-phosphate isomerase [Rubrobacter radiotolerans]|uniref:Triosephosphate isomerase n=1 Tax=Rubrobacter radiotolerans TaxID=42256 RepID=A0A023X4V4_RUBRA|nr:triose-phosphate isomerase [Rubrobacter radiotolerans]AHY47064.1 tim: triose-phosphate isomerase [Rubrobacter radiotolerans]MDX5894470.1 triose-phosphate isomerase [Rubrobacter radiotolerans]SMC06070.1 triosephosphate isomerase [Rubrobacter radiotolerans DSM 5868]
MARRPIMAANWKMNKTLREAEDYTAALIPRAEQAEGVDVAVFVPFTVLNEVARMSAGTPVIAGAQNFYYEDSGAYTGEVSAPMLQDVGARAVLIGHSERREIFSESDDLVAKKTKRALDAGLLPVVCCGETKEERDSGGFWEKIKTQISSVMDALEGDVDGEKIVFAYEPIWAIGTGDTASPEDAQDAIGKIRDLLRELRGDAFADSVRILYGGSVKPENIEEIMAQPDVDGGLVGGASLDVESFGKLVEAATRK